MTPSKELDIGPLTWVSGEIDQALTRAADAISQAASDPSQRSQLQFAKTHLHQARGALSIVGLDGACQFADALDALLSRMIDGSAPLDEAHAGLARRGCSAIANYLGEIVSGRGDQPLRLFALYREIAAANGAGEVSAADMFYPDLSRRMPRRRLQGAPKPGSPAGEQRMRGARAALERGLLQWLRDPADRSGPNSMRDAAIALEALQASPAFHTLWRVAQAFFDSLAHQDLPASEMRIKQLCTGLAKEVRHQASTSHRIPERLMRDLLFEIGQAPVRTPTQRQVRQAWNLDAWWAEPGDGVADIPLGPLLRNLRAEISNAKHDWDAFSTTKQASAVQDFDTRIGQIASEATRLGRPALQSLLSGTVRLSGWLREDPAARSSEALVIEVATALLLAELNIEGGIADAELSTQGQAALDRFEALMRGQGIGTAPDASFEAARRAHEWDARQQVTREIASNLGQIEQSLDDFFRNHAKYAPLANLATPLRQIEGALTLIGGEEAVPVVRKASRTIARLADGQPPTEAELTTLADQMSTLGFFVGALQHGPAQLDDFLPPEQRKRLPAEAAPEFEIDFEETVAPEPPAAEPQSVDETPSAPTRAPAPQISAPTPATDAEVDAELLAIFIEEAHEVLGAIEQGLETLTPHGNQESLVDIRRGFHTLKGSGRMVGLGEFGEASWAIEQTLNRWLQLEWPVTEELHALIGDAHRSFSDWVAQIESGGSHGWNFRHIAAEAERLRAIDVADGEAPAAGAGAPADLAATVVEAPTLQAETEQADETPLPELAAVTPPPFDFGDLPSLDLDDTPEAVIEVVELPEEITAEDLPEDLAEVFDLDPLPPPAEVPIEGHTAEALAQAPAAPSPGADPVTLGDAEVSRALFDLYLVEARGHLGVLKNGLRPMRRNPAKPSEKLLRTAHTLAGISGTAHIPSVQGLARALELTLARLRESGEPASPEQVEVLTTSVDTLEAMVAEVALERLPLAVPELEQQLESIGRPATDEASGFAAAAGAGIDAEPTATPSPAEPETAGARPDQAASDEEPVSHVHDDLDEQLLPIFLEEADDLMSSLNERLRVWQSDPGNAEHARLAARQLHTLKGSARMAGAMQLGELVHRLESRLETGIARQHEPAGLIDEITAGLDTAAHLIATLGGVPSAPSEMAPTPAPAAAEHDDSAIAIAIETAAEGGDATPQGGGTLRVRADTLGGFINTAGEIGISRTRIEGELRTLRRSLLDLTENVIRLRNQLREVELQAETQMQSRIAQADSQHGEFDPLEMDRYTRLQELTRMMAESVGDVTTVQQQLLRNLDGAELALHSQARFTRDLQQAMMQVRMVPFDSLADRLYRVVRQSAKDQGKRVNLDIRGGRIEIDRSVLERMTIAIEHMLRNAVAHGIEPVEQRRTLGKEDIGQVTLSISQTGNEIAIDLADDGRGLDYAAIAARGLERGLIGEDDARDERKLTNLIFTAGFSTADAVSTIAGRGVGMDVVRAEAAALGGRIDVQAASGQGTRFRIYLPLTLAVTQALLVRAAHTTYAIPSTMIAQALELRADAVERVRADGFAEWQGQRYGYRYLPELLGDRRARPEIHRFNWVVLLRAGGEHLALHIDALRGNQEIVVKSAGPQLLRVVGISGATVLGDGEIVLILNPIALARRSEPPAEVMDAVLGDDLLDIGPTTIAPHQPTVLVVDDSLTVRKITGRLLEREGYRVLTAKDGSDALDQLDEILPDVILSDIEMPRMDGFDFVRNLRAEERTRNIPVIMITSRLADKHREYAERLGANDYLGKPYDEDELLRLLRRYTTSPSTLH